MVQATSAKVQKAAMIRKILPYLDLLKSCSFLRLSDKSTKPVVAKSAENRAMKISTRMLTILLHISFPTVVSCKLPPHILSMLCDVGIDTTFKMLTPASNFHKLK